MTVEDPKISEGVTAPYDPDKASKEAEERLAAQRAQDDKEKKLLEEAQE